jgi:hypothetical protein
MAYLFYFLGLVSGIATYRYYLTHKDLFKE